MCGVWLTVFTLNIFEHSIKNLRLQAFRIYQMHCYFLNSFWHIQRQNVPKTFGTPCISSCEVCCRLSSYLKWKLWSSTHIFFCFVSILHILQKLHWNNCFIFIKICQCRSLSNSVFQNKTENILVHASRAVVSNLSNAIGHFKKLVLWTP